MYIVDVFVESNEVKLNSSRSMNKKPHRWTMFGRMPHALKKFPIKPPGPTKQQTKMYLALRITFSRILLGECKQNNQIFHSH